jgi:ribosomal protein L34E
VSRPAPRTTCVAPDEPALPASVSCSTSRSGLASYALERIEATHDVHGYLAKKREALKRCAKCLAELQDGRPPEKKRVSHNRRRGNR